MKHPSFDIISALEHADLFHPDLALQQSIRDHVRSMPVFMPGEQIDMPDDQIATQFCMEKVNGETLLLLSVYLREADVVAAYGQGEYFEAPFDLAILFADSNRVDVELCEDMASLRIAHDTLLQIRDLGGMEEPAIAPSDDDIAAQRDAMFTFAVRARAYCSRHPDIDMLHLGTLTRPGVAPMLVGALCTQHLARHTRALKELSMKVFAPRWRFLLLDDGSGTANILRDLRNTAPCYRKVEGQSWFDRLKSKTKTPTLAIIGM